MAMIGGLEGIALRRKPVRGRQVLFRSGQPSGMLYLVHAGIFKTSVASADGRERITGFHLPGDLLGGDSIGLPVHSCDAVSLDVGEVHEIPFSLLQQHPEALPHLAGMLTCAIRRDWQWMLDLGSLSAEQRATATADHARRGSVPADDHGGPPGFRLAQLFTIQRQQLRHTAHERRIRLRHG